MRFWVGLEVCLVDAFVYGILQLAKVCVKMPSFLAFFAAFMPRYARCGYEC